MTFTVHAIYHECLLTYCISTCDYVEFKGTLIDCKGDRKTEPPQKIILIKTKGRWTGDVEDETLIKDLAAEIEHYFKYQL